MDISHNIKGESIYRRRSKEFIVEVTRIERLLEETVKKLEFAMTIPDLIENQYTLVSTLLSTTDAFLVRKAFLKYLGRNEESWKFLKSEQRKEFLSAKSIKELEQFFNSYEPEIQIISQKDEYDCSKALHILYENPRIKELSSRYIEGISEGAFNFLQDIKFLFYASVANIKLTPEEAVLKEEYLRQMYGHQDELLDYATVMQVQMSEQVKKDMAFIKTKEDEMRDWETKINMIRKECEEYIEKSGKEADKTMILDWKRSELKQEVLLAQIHTNVTNIGNLRKRYVDEEKELRVKKYQTEQQLIAMLQQYDRDMQERQEMYEYKREVHQREKEQLNQLQSRYEEQTAEYEMMMKEKNDYEQRLIEGRMYEVHCKMSARKIQRFYRNYRTLNSVHGKEGDGLKSAPSRLKKKSKT